MKSKHTILWADDDADDREMFREVLKAHASDHEVIEFENGKELLNYLNDYGKHHLPCLIVLDLNMPVLGGRETLATLKHDPKLQHIPVAVFTTSSNPADKNYCDRFQVVMLTKPPSYNQLKSAVERLVDLCDDQKQKRA